jgi:hypothetical protein
VIRWGDCSTRPLNTLIGSLRPVENVYVDVPFDDSDENVPRVDEQRVDTIATTTVEDDLEQARRLA